MGAAPEYELIVGQTVRPVRVSSSIRFPQALCALVFLVGLLSGCAPDPVYRLRAHDPDSTGFWQQGRQVLTRTADSLQVAAAYARTTNEGHKFRLAFVNRSSVPYTVDPTEVYAVVTKALSDERYAHPVENEQGTTYEFRRDTLSVADTLRARDPERVLLQIDRERARAEADAEKDAAASAFFLTLDAVSEIASGPQSPDERTADAAEDTEAQLRRAEEQDENRRAQSRLSQRRARWAQSALRRTTLMPGMRTTGFVYVPVDPNAARLVLHVDLGARTVTVPFRQRRYEP
jgi:hypothetical protein